MEYDGRGVGARVSFKQLKPSEASVNCVSKEAG